MLVSEADLLKKIADVTALIESLVGRINHLQGQKQAYQDILDQMRTADPPPAPPEG